MPKKNLSFTDQLNTLGRIIQQLEEETIGLEESIQLFERGVKQVKICEKQLQQAEQTVQQLIEKNGQQTLEDFSTES